LKIALTLAHITANDWATRSGDLRAENFKNLV